MSKHCPKCDGYMVEHSNSDKYFCISCGYDEHHEESKDEVLYIVEHALSYLGMSTNEDDFTVSNGSCWTREGIMKFLKENLK